jgi:hypothetical protein
MTKIRFNPNKTAWAANVAAREQAAAEAAAEQAAVERLPWFVRAAHVTQVMICFPFAVVFKHGEIVEGGWRSARRIRRAWRILRSGRAAPRTIDARWQLCNPCPQRQETDRGSFCRNCGCGASLVARSRVLRLAARIPIARRIPAWLIHVGRLEHQNTLAGWDCPLGLFAKE